MAETLQFEHVAIEGAEDALPYRLEVLDAEGAVKALIATTRSASLAYACYYGAVREYVGEPLRLCFEGRVLATSATPGD